MKKFRAHIEEAVLLEKVSQKEYKDAAADTNIMIGIEYEVVDSQLVSNPNAGLDMDRISSDYDSFIEEIVGYSDELFESRQDWEEEQLDQRDKRAETHAQKARELRSDEEDKEEDAEQFEEQISEEEEKLNDMDADAGGYEELADRIEFLKTKLETLRTEIDELDEEASEEEEEAEKFNDMYVNEYAEEYGDGDWDGESPPYFDSGEYGEWIENFYGDSIPTNDEITSWVFEAGEYGSERISRTDVQIHLLEYLPSPEPDYYDEESGEIDEDSDAYTDLVSDVTKGEYPLTGSYHSSTDYTKWRIEDDSSLNAGGAEIISPVLPLKAGIKSIENMFDWINTYADTDSSTGLHINMSFKNYDMSKFDWLKLLMFIEEGAIYKEFEDRKGNSYARPVASYLEKIKSNPDDIGSKDYFKALGEGKKAGFQKIKDKMGAGKFFGVNFSSISSGGSDGRIEFRYLGGNYHKKEKEVIKQILRYAAWMKIALDPQYKRKEYLKKLSKVALDVSSAEDYNSMLTSIQLLGRSEGSSGDKTMELAYDWEKKMILGFQTSDKKLIYKEKLSKALMTPRIKQYFAIKGISISKLIKSGTYDTSPKRSEHYMAALRKFNPEGKVSNKEMNAFIIKYKQPR